MEEANSELEYFRRDLRVLILDYQSQKRLTIEQHQSYVLKFDALRHRARELGLNFLVESENIKRELGFATIST